MRREPADCESVAGPEGRAPRRDENRLLRARIRRAAAPPVATPADVGFAQRHRQPMWIETHRTLWMVGSRRVVDTLANSEGRRITMSRDPIETSRQKLASGRRSQPGRHRDAAVCCIRHRHGRSDPDVE